MRVVASVCLLAAGSPLLAANSGSAARALELNPVGGVAPDLELASDLDRLLEQELHGLPDELWAADPSFALQVMILRAGRELPPTISAARRAEREELRGAALAWLRLRLDSDPTFRETWVQVGSALLADLEQELLWCATARTLGQLQELDLARELAIGLGSERPEIVHAARAALFDLYLQWFPDVAAVQAEWDRTGGVCDGDLLRQRALHYERESREEKIRNLAFAPQRALALLDHDDPRLRAAAARALGGSINGEAEPAVALLLAHLPMEFDGAAFHATAEALLEALASASPDAAPLVELRATVTLVIESGPANLQAPAAYALAHTPWSTIDGDPASILIGIEVLAGQLERLTQAGTLTDRDVLVTSLQELWSLGGSAERAGLELGTRVIPVRDVVLQLIREEREFEGVRVAAARLLPIVCGAQDITAAVEVLNAPTTSSELGYTLLAGVGEMARGMGPDDIAGRLVLDTLLARLSMQDPDLRRRALSYLSDEDLAALTSQADPRRFITSLGEESLPELQAQLLPLIAKHGSQAQVEQLLALANFDAIANSGPAGISQLVQTLKALAQGDAALVLRTAERLLAVNNDDTRVVRLREALTLIAELDPVAAATLADHGHDGIVSWAREVRQAGLAVPGGKDFLRRLVDVHIPGCTHSAGEGLPNLAHLQALFLSDIVALDPEAGDATQVLAHFEKARAFAAENGRALEQARVLRDRARFHLKRGEDVQALADYRAVFAAVIDGDAAAAAAAESVLDLSDLRRGGELIAAQSSATAEANPTASASFAREALSVSLALVRREAWTREPKAVRVEDLRDLAARATLSAASEACDLALPLFVALPELPPEPVEGEAPAALPAAPDGATWNGLLGDRAIHSELLELAADLETRRAELELAESGAKPAPVEDAPPEDDPPTGEEGTAESEAGASEETAEDASDSQRATQFPDSR